MLFRNSKRENESDAVSCGAVKYSLMLLKRLLDFAQPLHVHRALLKDTSSTSISF